MTIDQIIHKVQENNPKADIALLEKAYEFAARAHGSQKRRTGAPYIQHSLHTAFVLAQIKADLSTIMAGILPDVPGDTEYTLDDIHKNFGGEVTPLVQGITKVSKKKYRGGGRD